MATAIPSYPTVQDLERSWKRVAISVPDSFEVNDGGHLFCEGAVLSPAGCERAGSSRPISSWSARDLDCGCDQPKVGGRTDFAVGRVPAAPRRLQIAAALASTTVGYEGGRLC